MTIINTPRINRVMVGEALIGEGRELAHIDLIMGPRGCAAESAFRTALVKQKRHGNTMLSIATPDLKTQPATVMFSQVEITNGRQAEYLFGPVQQGVATAVADCVKDGIIPQEEAKDVFIFVGVFIHCNASDNAKIQEWNYAATKLAIQRAVEDFSFPAQAFPQENIRHYASARA